MSGASPVSLPALEKCATAVSPGDHYCGGVGALTGVPRFLIYCVVAGVLAAGVAAPVALGAGLLSNQVSDAVDGISATLASSDQPLVTTVTDRNGTPIATLFDQYRVPATYDQISDAAKAAIVSIED